MLGKPSKYILNLNLNQFSRGQKSNQGILCVLISSFYCYTHVWTPRKNKIGGQHTQDVEKIDNLLGNHPFSNYYQCQSYWKNCSTPVFWVFHTTPVWYSVKNQERDSSWSFWGVLLVCRTKFGINFHVCIWRLNSIDTRTNIFCIGFRCKYRGCQVLAGVVTGVDDPVLNFGLTLLEVKSVSDFNFRPEIRVRQVWCFLR